MAFIHTQPANFILRTIARPFRKIIPSRYYFAIDGTISIKLTEGRKMQLQANPTSNLLRVLFWNGYKGFESKEYSIFVELAKESKCFFDIGANIGYYSILAKLFNPKIEVHGFEPLPGARKYFQKNIELNGFSEITVCELALSEKTGSASFFASKNPRFKHLEDHLFGDNSLDGNFPSKVYEQVEIKVNTDTLDNYVSHNLKEGLRIDLMKLDTEGTENLVLRGGHLILSDHKPIIMCEVVRGYIEKEMEEILTQHNYVFFAIRAQGLELVSSLSAHEGKEDYFLVEESKLNLVRRFLIKNFPP